MTPRLATSLWVSALLRRAAAHGAFAAVLCRGDPVAGAVILVARSADGASRGFARVGGSTGPGWEAAVDAPPGDETLVTDWLARQTRYDPDLWAIELTGGKIEQLVAEPFRSI